MFNRRSFLALAAGSAALRAEDPPAKPASDPFADPDFGFTEQIVLGDAYHQVGDPGRLLAILARIKPGDFDSGYQAYTEAAVDCRQLAESAAAGRHRTSAREAYLWAAGYFSAALRFVDGTADPERALPCWKQYASCWSAAAALFEPAAERIDIPYENAALTGWFLRAGDSGRRRPLAILNTGADGLEISTYTRGAAGALSRGYHVLILNGPGQGDTLWKRKLYFRPDWEKVITPVVDAMLRRPDVDPKRIALIGVSMGGYQVPRALAFEHRIAAGVADPGVWDMSEPWMRALPPFVKNVLDSGNRSQFDQLMRMGTQGNKRSRMLLRFRMRPFGITSFFDMYRAIGEYRMAEVAAQIRCPMLITDPEDEQFFPGQAQKLYDALTCRKAMARFTRAEGAGQHCEVAAPGIRDYRIYNWLDEILS